MMGWWCKKKIIHTHFFLLVLRCCAKEEFVHVNRGYYPFRKNTVSGCVKHRYMSTLLSFARLFSFFNEMHWKVEVPLKMIGYCNELICHVKYPQIGNFLSFHSSFSFWWDSWAVFFTFWRNSIKTRNVESDKEQYEIEIIIESANRGFCSIHIHMWINYRNK